MAKEREAYMNLFPDDERDSPEEGTVAGHQGRGREQWLGTSGGRQSVPHWAITVAGFPPRNLKSI